MSLKKQITSKNGAVARYHRIGSIKKNYNLIEITIDSYAQEAYRDNEKELEELLIQKNLLIQNLFVLTAKGQLSEDELISLKEVEAKMDRIQELSAQQSFCLFQTNIQMETSKVDIISFNEIYNRLKNETELFKDAEDC